jgi:hypothetical protein
MLTLAFLAAASLAAPNDAETRLRSDIWQSYTDGYAVKTLSSTIIHTGTPVQYEVNLFTGNQYRILAAGDQDLVDLDLYVYDANGAVVAHDSVGAQPAVEFVPRSSGVYSVALYAKQESRSYAFAAMAVISKGGAPPVLTSELEVPRGGGTN